MKKTFAGEKFDIIREKMIGSLHKWAFTIVDPFDKTYNPTKQVYIAYENEKARENNITI